jgi:hypothetical protein
VAEGGTDAARLAAERDRLAALDLADAKARRERADDIAWVTRDRDMALAAVTAIAETFVALTSPNGDPAERPLRVAMFRRSMLDAGEAAMREVRRG